MAGVLQVNRWDMKDLWSSRPALEAGILLVVGRMDCRMEGVSWFCFTVLVSFYFLKRTCSCFFLWSFWSFFEGFLMFSLMMCFVGPALVEKKGLVAWTLGH